MTPPTVTTCVCGRPVLPRAVAVLTLCLAWISLTGCEAAGWLTEGVIGREKKVNVEAQYRGLDNKSVAVVVAADDRTLYGYPMAPLRVSQAISAQLAVYVPGVRLADPRQIVEFQYNNPHWSTLPYEDLLKRFKVDRLILVDLTHYSTHEPGNKYVWQGQVVANVSVAEADRKDPNHLAFATAVSAKFPEDSVVGVLDSDDEAMQKGMLDLFSRNVVRLFHDHQRIEK
jgi:hypothetical protein